MPLDLAELFADADEPANLAPGHIPAPGSFQPFDEFLIALIEIKPVEPAFLDQDRDAQAFVFGVEGGLVSQVEDGLALPGSKFLALLSFDLVLEKILLPLSLLEG